MLNVIRRENYNTCATYTCSWQSSYANNLYYLARELWRYTYKFKLHRTVIIMHIWKSRIKYIIIGNQVHKPLLCQILRLTCTVRYIQSEYIRVNTFFAISTGIINQRVNFNEVCKKSAISNLHIMNCKDYVLLKEYMQA